MIYGYIRVSSDKQTVENQRFELKNFVKRENCDIDEWIEETVSGTKKAKDRKLGPLLERLKKDDILICAEISRLGRNLLQIMSILNFIMEHEAKIWTVKEGYRLGDNIQSKVLAFAFSLSAEIERNLISQRTKEALARKKAEGIILGRPKGSKSKEVKLTGREEEIQKYLDLGLSFSAIARILGVHRLTLSGYAKNIMGEKGRDKNIRLLNESRWEIEELLKQGKSKSEITNIYKVSISCLNDRLKYWGI